MLSFKNKKILEKAKRIRWFGIDRLAKQSGTWKNDIKEIGYKYQMTDIGAALLLESIKEFSQIASHRKLIFNTYKKILSKNKNITVVDSADGKGHVHWLFTILVNKKDFLQKELRKKLIETNQVHFRNDKYSIFKKFTKNKRFPNMDSVEEKYLVLPIHGKVKLNDAIFIAQTINKILPY